MENKGGNVSNNTDEHSNKDKLENKIEEPGLQEKKTYVDWNEPNIS